MLSRMGRSATSIQAEITALETFLQSADSFVSSAGSDGTQLTRARRKELEDRLNFLYGSLGRANGTDPMFVRGHVTGLR